MVGAELWLWKMCGCDLTGGYIKKQDDEAWKKEITGGVDSVCGDGIILLDCIFRQRRAQEAQLASSPQFLVRVNATCALEKNNQICMSVLSSFQIGRKRNKQS